MKVVKGIRNIAIGVFQLLIASMIPHARGLFYFTAAVCFLTGVGWIYRGLHDAEGIPQESEPPKEGQGEV